MKALTIVSIFIIGLVSVARAQVILPLGLGQKNSTNIVCSDNDKFWTLNKEQDKFIVTKWDGSFWNNYPEIPTTLLNTLSTNPKLIAPKAIYFYKGVLYLALSNTTTNKLLLLKISGRTWQTVNTDKINVYDDIKFITTDQDLLLCGKISIDTKFITILKVDQNSCSLYAGIPTSQGPSDYFGDFEYCDGKVKAIGKFFTPSDQSFKYFAVYENGDWTTIPNTNFKNGLVSFGKCNNQIILAVYDFDGQPLSLLIEDKISGTYNQISNGLGSWEVDSISDFHQVGNYLWAAGHFSIPLTGQKASLAFWDGTKWSIPSLDYLGSDVKLNGENQAFIAGSFESHQGLLLNKTGVIDFGSAIIAGKVYYDLNQNCVQDIDEKTLSNALISLVTAKGDVFINTDYNGRYYFPVDSSVKYNIVELKTPKYHKVTCPENGIKATKHNPKQYTVAGVDFGIIANGVHTDASVKVNDYTGWRARQGFDEHYTICFTNRGTQNIETGTLIFKPDQRITDWVFKPGPLKWQDNIAEWDVKSVLGKPLKIGETYCIEAKATIPVKINLGETVLFDANILTYDIQDENLTDNQHILNQKIVAAIDPNDKQTKQSYHVLPNSLLDYKIRFQNTGSDTAYNILITDTLDSKLMINGWIESDVSHKHAINMNGSSTYWLDAQGIYRYKLAWQFVNILLPDDKTNEAASHGFITYNMKLGKKAIEGTMIKNRAFIYFDYQEPIITNSANNLVSTIGIPKLPFSENNFSVYPNPAHDNFFIRNPLKGTMKIAIINSLGQSVFTQVIAPENQINIETGSFTKGLYLIQAEGFTSVKLLID